MADAREAAVGVEGGWAHPWGGQCTGRDPLYLAREACEVTETSSPDGVSDRAESP